MKESHMCCTVETTNCAHKMLSVCNLMWHWNHWITIISMQI